MQETLADQIVIDSEDKAIELVEKLLSNEVDLKPDQICFKNWPVLSVKFSDDQGRLNGTITAKMASSIMSLQSAIDRTYAYLTKGTKDAKHLTLEEKKLIQVLVKIEEGSTDTKADLTECFTRIGQGLGSKISNMKSKHLTMILILVPLMGFGSCSINKFIQVNSDAETKIEMTQQESKRMEIMSRAMISSSEVGLKINALKPEYDHVKEEILKSALDADRVMIQGISLENDEVKSILSTPRESAVKTKLDGIYKITKSDNSSGAILKINVTLIKYNVTFSTAIDLSSINSDQKKLLAEAIIESNPIHMDVTVSILRGQVTESEVKNIRRPEPYEIVNILNSSE